MWTHTQSTTLCAHTMWCAGMQQGHTVGMVGVCECTTGGHANTHNGGHAHITYNGASQWCVGMHGGGLGKHVDGVPNTNVGCAHMHIEWLMHTYNQIKWHAPPMRRANRTHVRQYFNMWLDCGGWIVVVCATRMHDHRFPLSWACVCGGWTSRACP